MLSCCMLKRSRSPLAGCRTALINALAVSAPHLALDKNGYVADVRENLIEGVALDDFESDLRQGDGNELEGKFRAAHSSCALAVNSFAPFRSDPAALPLPVGKGFTSLCFERKCPHGLVGRRSPNLDVVVDGPMGVVAIESKCLEPLTRHVAYFSPAYEEEIRDFRRDTAWFAEMLRLRDEWLKNDQRKKDGVQRPSCTYHWLDAAQHVKHAFGVALEFEGRPSTLLYLFWEPSNPEDFPMFAEHRAEIKEFAASIAGGTPDFLAMSYPELWGSWSARTSPEWLRGHVSRLKLRYGVNV